MIYEQVRHSLSDAKLTGLHWKIWFLSAMGLFLDGYDLFVISIALPLIIQEFAPSPVVQGIIGSSAVLGMIFGASIGGRLTDHFGRRSIYVIDLIIFVVFTTLSAFSWDAFSLIVCRFCLGIGIGADYPICASYVSEIMPSRIRGKMLIGAFSFQALGCLCAAIVGLFVLSVFPKVEAWRWILVTGAVPAFITLFLRMNVFESPFWLAAHGRYREAVEIVKKLTGTILEPLEPNGIQQVSPKWRELFKSPNLLPTIFSSGPWFLMDVPAYGVGVFTPIILAALITKQAYEGSVADIFSTITGTAFVDLFLVMGFLLNLSLIEKWGRIRLQLYGFIGMALGMCILAGTSLTPEHSKLYLVGVFAGFGCFNLCLNAGPAATTFTIPAEVFHTKMRATGHGFGAACAKCGAFLGIFFLPILNHSMGLAPTLLLLASFSVIGWLLTLILGIETKGKILT